MPSARSNDISGWDCSGCGLPLRHSDTLPGEACPACGSEDMTSNWGEE